MVDTVKPPKKIKVGHYIFKVKKLRGADGQAHGVTGRFQADQGRILHVFNVHPATARDTLLHETLHGIFYAASASTVLDIEDDVEEKIVSLLTSGLLSVLRDNPDLVAYLVHDDYGVTP